MPPTLLILPTASDRADDVRFVLAPESIPHPDERINGVLSRLALERPHFTWREAEERLTAEVYRAACRGGRACLERRARAA